MAFALSKINPRQTFNVLQVLSSPFIKQCHWFPHYKPGKFPTTEKERIKNAKKYNLLPEEYKPVESDMDPMGDYPDLPLEPVLLKDPYYNWDYPELRRNYNEPLPVDHLIMLPICWGHVPDQPYKKLILRVITILSVFGLVSWCLSQIKFCHPTLEKQLVQSGVTHYTFELDYSKKK